MTIFRDASNRTYEELEASVKELQKERPNWMAWQYLKRVPLTVESIDRLVKDGWVVASSGGLYDAGCVVSRKKINIDKRLANFERDISIMHESLHAWYSLTDMPDILNDHWGAKSEHEIRTVVEFTARKLRANPEMLAHTIHAFGLEPQLYDKVSYHAFGKHPVDLHRQLEFGFAKGHYDILRKVQME